MGWFLLVLAIVLEVSGTTCMKFSDGFKEIVPSVLVFVFYGLSFTAFIYALKTIDPSISYAIWAGLGLALITAIGILYFKRPLKKRCGILPAGGLGVSPSFKSPPRLGDIGGSFRLFQESLQRTGDHLKDGIYCAHTYRCDRLELERSQGINGENRFNS